MKRLLSILLVGFALFGCGPQSAAPTRVGIATPPPSGRTITFDPSVVGLPAAIGTTVYDSAGVISWTKYAVSNTAWRPVPVSPLVTGDPSQAPGLKAPIGFTVTMNDGTASWIKKTSSDTGWVINPVVTTDAGGGGGSACITVDGGTCAPITLSPDHFVALSGAATSITLSGLNGNAEGGYWIDFCGQTALVSAAGWQFMPNGLATNLNAFAADGKVGGSSRTDWFFANSGLYGFSSGTLFCVQGHMTARTGRVRQFQVEGFTNDTNKESLKIVGQWGDTTTNLTSMTVQSNQANGLTNTGTTGTYLRMSADNTDQ